MLYKTLLKHLIHVPIGHDLRLEKRFKLKVCKGFFIVRASWMWNSLPASVVVAVKSLEIFIRSLEVYLHGHNVGICACLVCWGTRVLYRWDLMEFCVFLTFYITINIQGRYSDSRST